MTEPNIQKLKVFVKMAAALKEILPPAKSSAYDHSSDPWLKQRYSSVKKEDDIKTNPIVFLYKTVPEYQDFDDSDFINYKPLHHHPAAAAGAMERIIRMVERPADPLEPPKFKHKRVPKLNGSPPVPVMHSPPRPVTVEDQKDWKIPPSISNWKNAKGYTIPLDKRLAVAAAADGYRGFQINDNFAQLSEALYVAEQHAREAVSMRSKVQKEIMMKQKERKEQQLRALAKKARSGTTGSGSFLHDAASMTDTEHQQGNKHRNDRDWGPPKRETSYERIQRVKIREERQRERERERRLDATMGKRRKITRDRDRDVSEKVALGMAGSSLPAREVMYDQRLFNQQKGIDSGFVTDDHRYNVYDTALFTAKPTLSTLYRPKKDDDDDMYGGEELEKTYLFKPDYKDFKSVAQKNKKGPRDHTPIDFERDPFGLDQFITQVKSRVAVGLVGFEKER